MAAEMQQVDSDHSSQVFSPSNSEEKDFIKANLADVEGNIDADDTKVPLYRPEETELTPAEAFRWNVDGDQSPCKSLGPDSINKETKLRVLSSRGRSIRIQHR